MAKTIIETRDFQKHLERYSALSNKNRLLIYNLIKQEKMCNCVLAQILSLTEGSVTHHTKILENAGLIIGRKKGHFTIYYTPENLKKII
ncbi:MAG: ArsR/SmtB family transcription factor [Promethearchaeota archaeon]